ncbi:Ubiquinol-cytochrome C chaperone [hydrothermal vent metagenome]|uniref:Ubiquinol-cytochrome C chaperone n=1 Tax=hydrothermal vent metagenome TaxID=652676 RepID=A0A3B0S2D9_9ZZZZ
MFNFLNRDRKIKNKAHKLFTYVVEQARKPEFYREWGVADSLDGRFDLVILHLSLLIDRLEDDGKNRQKVILIRTLQEALFDNMDMSLREMGVGDMSVGKKVKVMAEAFYGRKKAYQEAIVSTDAENAVKAALIRNIYRDRKPEDHIIDLFASYVIRQVKYLGRQSDEDFISAKVFFEEVK